MLPEICSGYQILVAHSLNWLPRSLGFCTNFKESVKLLGTKSGSLSTNPNSQQWDFAQILKKLLLLATRICAHAT